MILPIIEKLKDLETLRRLLSIEDNSKPKRFHTFYKYQGNVLEIELSKFEYEKLPSSTKSLYKKKSPKLNGDCYFELNEQVLMKKGVEIEKMDWGRPSKLAENKIEFQIIWDNVVSQKTEKAKKKLDNHELEDVRLELKEQLLIAKTRYESAVEAGYRDNVLTATYTKFIEFLDSFDNNPENSKDYLKNPYPTIFTDDSFTTFQLLIDKFEDKSEYQKISFIVQKLKLEDKLVTTNCKILSQWFVKNGFIKKETYNQIQINGYFLSPSKILTDKRLTLYNSIIGI